MNDDAFENIIDKSLNDLPEEFKKKLDNVNITFSDWPTTEQLKKSHATRGRSLLLGLYEGVPQTKRRGYGIGGQLPDKITIFKHPILAISSDNSQLIENIKDTVIHEIAHHFGLSDKQIYEAKKK
jgi:predicted Zn-dependent protease with MMP-like domain